MPTSRDNEREFREEGKGPDLELEVSSEVSSQALNNQLTTHKNNARKS